MRVPRRVGEHLQAIKLRLRPIFGHFKRLGLRPVRLPFLVQFLRVIIGHGDHSRIAYEAGAPATDSLEPDVRAGLEECKRRGWKLAVLDVH
jgi:hypothetical protein